MLPVFWATLVTIRDYFFFSFSQYNISSSRYTPTNRLLITFWFLYGNYYINLIRKLSSFGFQVFTDWCPWRRLPYGSMPILYSLVDDHKNRLCLVFCPDILNLWNRLFHSRLSIFLEILKKNTYSSTYIHWQSLLVKIKNSGK